MFLEIKGIKKSFGAGESHVDVLKGIDLEIEKGEFCVLLGPSGSGKTTLLRIIAGLEHQTSGHIRFHGTDVSRLHARDRKVGFVFQHYALFRHMTVFDNIAFGLTVLPRRERPNAAAIKAKVTKLLEMVQLAHLADRYLAQLSGGQKQRVAIARALATNPKVLLCDEATSALDPNTTHAILQLISDINKRLGITAIIITHEMSVIEKICNQVAIISHGRIAETGSVEEVFFHPQTEEARQLVIPEALQDMPHSRLYRIIFNGRSSFEPAISNLVLECGAPVNIMFADTRDIGGTAFGQMVLQLPDNEDVVRRILAYADSKGLMLEEMKNV